MCVTYTLVRLYSSKYCNYTWCSIMAVRLQSSHIVTLLKGRRVGIYHGRQSSHICYSIEGKTCMYLSWQLGYRVVIFVALLKGRRVGIYHGRQSSHICYSIEGKTCMYLSWQLGYRVVIFGPLLKGRHVCIYHGS